MFEKSDVLGIHKHNNTMRVGPGLKGNGTLAGVMFIWPTQLQPRNVEWAAVVKFLVSDPQEIYFVCDIVHAHLMKFVSDTKDTVTLSMERTMPADDLLKQAKHAHLLLGAIAEENHLTVVTDGTLGVTLTGSDRLTHMNHFYALDGETPNPLLTAASKCDPQLQRR